MAIEINVTNRERIYINPNTGERIPKIQKGLINLDNAGELEKGGAYVGDTEEAKAKENL
jgi:hypothetical protein